MMQPNERVAEGVDKQQTCEEDRIWGMKRC